MYTSSKCIPLIGNHSGIRGPTATDLCPVIASSRHLLRPTKTIFSRKAKRYTPGFSTSPMLCGGELSFICAIRRGIHARFVSPTSRTPVALRHPSSKSLRLMTHHSLHPTHIEYHTTFPKVNPLSPTISHPMHAKFKIFYFVSRGAPRRSEGRNFGPGGGSGAWRVGIRKPWRISIRQAKPWHVQGP